MPNQLAQKEYGLGGRFEGFGLLGRTGWYADDPWETANIFNRVISVIIGFMTVIAGLWFVFQFIIGALGWLSSGGDKARVQESQRKITNATIGLAITIAAVFIIDLISKLFGLKILNPGNLILRLWR